MRITLLTNRETRYIILTNKSQIEKWKGRGWNMRSYLKVARESKGYTQQYVADSIGISQNYYCDIENGVRQKEIRAVLMFKLSELLEIPFETMINEEKKIKKEVV